MTWGNPETMPEKLLSALLTPAALAYGLGRYCHLLAYTKGYLERQHIGVPVISIGNITCGGTGKTPITIDIAQHLIAQGFKVAILSRGYKRLSHEPYVIVSNGEGHLATPYASGDEPYMMACAVPEAIIIVGRKRSVAAAIATKVYQANVLLLDDGFQHWPLHRHQDIVVLDYNDNPLKDALLPAGRLREPFSALGRANIAVISKVPQEPDPAKLITWRRLINKWAPNAQLTSCRFLPHRLYAPGKEEVSLSPIHLNSLKVIALSGIAKPSSFLQLLVSLGAEVVSCLTFPDHHWFTESDIKKLTIELAKTNADFIVTTAKDSIRLESSLAKQLPIRVLDLQLEWLGSPTLPELVLEKLSLPTVGRNISLTSPIN